MEILWTENRSAEKATETMVYSVPYCRAESFVIKHGEQRVSP